MAQVPEWTIGQSVEKGALRTYTQGGRVDVFVALQDSDVGSVWSAPPSSPTFWLELDNYNGSYISGVAYPKGHVVDHAAPGGEVLWYIAAEDISAGQGAPGTENGPNWLLFGGRRTPAIPSVTLCKTLWRVPFTIVRPDQAVATGVNLEEPPEDGQLLIRAEAPVSGSDASLDERIIAVSELLSLSPVAVGADLLDNTDAPPGSSLPLGVNQLDLRTSVARTTENMLLIQFPRSKTLYPSGQVARFTFAHDAAWPEIFFAATGGDVQFNVSEHGTIQSQLSSGVTNRLAPTPTPETRGQYVRQSKEGENYELTLEAPAVDAFASYATVDEFRNRTNLLSAAENDEIAEQLEAVSRLVDQELRLMPGAFAPHEATYHFQTDGGSTLYLRDDSGFAYPLRSVVADGIRPDFDRERTYTEYLWDFDDAWLWPIPNNGPQIGIPYESIEIRRGRYGYETPYTYWPIQHGSVQIEGAWGWAAIPGAIRELVCHITRDMRDSLLGGSAQRMEVVDDTTVFRPDTWRLWAQVKSRYGSKRVMTMRTE